VFLNSGFGYSGPEFLKISEMSEYITLAEAKKHCRVDWLDDDDYIQDLCDAAEIIILNEIKGSLIGEGTVAVDGVNITGTDTDFLDLHIGDSIQVLSYPIKNIATITSDTVLTVDTAFLTTGDNLTYKIYTGMPLEDGALPLPLKIAILFMVAHYYMVREPIIVGTIVAKTPFAVDYLIAPYKNYNIA
jgi:hypothetical protein